jgi:hypothetical protein
MYIHSEHTRNVDRISFLAEHKRKCLKVEYLGRIALALQKSRVTGPWDQKDTVSAKKVKKIQAEISDRDTLSAVIRFLSV